MKIITIDRFLKAIPPEMEDVFRLAEANVESSCIFQVQRGEFGDLQVRGGWLPPKQAVMMRRFLDNLIKVE